MRIDFDKYSLIRFILPMIVGMGGANLCIDAIPISAIYLLPVLLLALVFMVVFLKQGREDRFAVAGMVFAFVFGAFLFINRYRNVEHGISRQADSCRGVLLASPEEKEHSFALNIKQENGTKILLYVQKSDEVKSLNVGDTVLARLLHINLTADVDDSDEYASYRRYLFYNGTCATAYSVNGAWKALPAKHKEQNVFDCLASMQDTLHEVYTERLLNAESRGVIEAMTIGRKKSLSPELRQKYSSAGVSHVLALSGFHVGILFLILQFFTLANFIPYHWRAPVNCLIIVALWCFDVIAGMPPSLTRATAMLTIITLCTVLRRDTVMAVQSCFITAAIMLCYDPLMLMDIGFQLSFVAVIAITTTLRRITELSRIQNPVLDVIWSIIMTSLVCSLITAPLVAYHFGSIPMYGILANLLITPLVYFVMWGSVLWWMSLAWDALNEWIASCLTSLVHGMNSTVSFVSSLPYSTISFSPSLLDVALLYVVILISVIFLHHPYVKHLIRLLVSVIVVLVVMILESI